MEFDKPDKEVQRPRGNDVADWRAVDRTAGGASSARLPAVAAACRLQRSTDNSREFARDTRATTEMPEMATTHQAFRALRCKYIILAGLAELAALLR